MKDIDSMGTFYTLRNNDGNKLLNEGTVGQESYTTIRGVCLFNKMKQIEYYEYYCTEVNEIRKLILDSGAGRGKVKKN